jgi:selenocysteine-specific translation elongation factor
MQPDKPPKGHGAMKHLTVGIFHDDTIARELGKKNTESDIVMFSRKLEDYIFTFMYPVEDKLSAKSQIISSVDAAIVGFTGITKELGETVVMLDALNISNGVSVTSPYATPEQIAAITKGTSLESFIVGKRDPIRILEVLKRYNPERDSISSLIVVVDHSFSVKGVGEVILGFVKKGVVKKYDELTLLPANKKVIVRSIQMQDEDYDKAEAGSRVGLAIKGAAAEEMRRGSIICASDDVKASTKLNLSFTKSTFYTDNVRQGVFHATVGMQTVPITLTEENRVITVTFEKTIVYTSEDTFLILDLNGRKTRIMGKAEPLES